PSSWVFPLNAQVGEIMVFERLSTPDRRLVDLYLSQKWKVESMIDSDGDGVPDSRDAFPNDPNKVVELTQYTPELAGLSDAGKSALKLWASSTPNAFELDAFNRVAKWYDYSGYRRHLTHLSGTRPFINSNAMNGLPAAQFDGTGRLSWDGSAIVGRPYTIFLVEKTTVTVANSWILFGSGDTVASNLVFGYSADGTIANSNHRDTIGYSYSYSVPSLLKNTPLIHTFSYANTGVMKQGYINGQLTGSTGQWNGYLTSYANAGIGGVSGIWSSPWQGALGELMVFDVLLSDADRAIVHSYLSKKWGVSLDSDGDGVPDTKDKYPLDRTAYVEFTTEAPQFNQLSPSAKNSLVAWMPPPLPNRVEYTASGRIGTWYDWSNRGNHFQVNAEATAPIQEHPGCGPVPSGTGVVINGTDCILQFNTVDTTPWHRASGHSGCYRDSLPTSAYCH
ncbi:hypothetical protein EBZ35_08000, partial [bacterium]|nr:hypothetical protein [bacterium]